MTGGQRRGPAKLDPARVVALFAEPRWASLCVETPDGSLRTAPVWVERASLDALGLALPPACGIDPARGLPACVVADRFESYEGIEGGIVRGVLRAAGSGTVTRELTITRLHGFSFGNTTTSLEEAKEP